MYDFCNIMHVFDVTFDQFNASLQNKSISLTFLLTPNFWIAVYIF